MSRHAFCSKEGPLRGHDMPNKNPARVLSASPGTLDRTQSATLIAHRKARTLDGQAPQDELNRVVFFAQLEPSSDNRREEFLEENTCVRQL